MKYQHITAGAAALILSSTSAFALTVTNTIDAAALAAATLSGTSGVTILSGTESLLGGATQQGTYSGFNLTSNTSDPDLSLTDGVVLTSGAGNFSTTENTTNNFTAATGTGPYQPLVDLASAGGLNTSQNDSNVLSFDFTLDDPTENSVTAQFIFGTDEFPTQSVTDIMGIFVNGVNFAFFPNGDLVSNQSGDPSGFFNDNAVGSDASTGYGIEWNGLTDVFTVTMLAEGGGLVNTIEIAIADTSDTIYDSAVFFTGITAGTTDGGGGIEVPSVPLPAGLPLLLSGLGGIFMMRRKKKSA